MNDVTIMETIYHYKPLVPSYWPFILGLIVVITCVIGIIGPHDSPLQKPLVIFNIICLASMIITLLLSSAPNKNNIERISYKVKVDDNVTFGGFNKYYEIESVEEDNIYIVKRRTFDYEYIYKEKE